MAYIAGRGSSSLAINQMNIVFPPEAFTNEAVNFWVGVAFGVGICVAYAAMTR